MRPGLEQKAPDLASSGQAGDEDEEEDEAFDEDATYATLSAAADAPDAWQSPVAGVGSKLGGSVEGSLSATGAGNGSGGVDESGTAVLDAATTATRALQELSDAAPRAHGVRSLPPSAHAAAVPIDVASIPPELLAQAGAKPLPPTGKWVRTAYDHNLDGLTGDKPWRPPARAAASAASPTATSQAMDAAAQAQALNRLPEFFNYGLTEAAWVVYARKQREVSFSLVVQQAPPIPMGRVICLCAHLMPVIGIS